MGLVLTPTEFPCHLIWSETIKNAYSLLQMSEQMQSLTTPTAFDLPIKMLWIESNASVMLIDISIAYLPVSV